MSSIGCKHIVALSGGKDSTALALRLAEVEPRDYDYICTPTGNELPEMFSHWRKIGELLGKPIIPVTDTTLGSLITKQNALPNFRQRWCTRMIKIEPFARYCAALGDATAYIGLRADEPLRTGASGLYETHGIAVRYPLREWGWGLSEVQDYLREREVSIPQRTDCAVCFFQRLGEWHALWRNHPDEFAKGEAWESQTGHTFRSAGRDSWPASLKGLRELFEQGALPKDAQQRLFDDGGKCRVCSM